MSTRGKYGRLHGSLVGTAAVYPGSQQPCDRCGNTIEVRKRRDGRLHLCRDCRGDHWYIANVDK